MSQVGAWAGRHPQTTPGLWITRSPMPGMCQGARWRSHVPAFPLCMHAPLCDPGGVPPTRHCVSGTAAFRCLATVGLPRDPALRARLLSTTRHFSGCDHAAGLLVPSSFVRPLLGVHVDCTPDLLAGLWSGGTGTCCAHPLGNNNQLHEIALNSKVSGFPWRDQAYVRQLEQDYDAPGAEAPRPRRDDDFNPEHLMHELEDFLRQEREGRGD
jgi:hypothetical protein